MESVFQGNFFGGITWAFMCMYVIYKNVHIYTHLYNVGNFSFQ
jgi:hypothetical protein